PGLKGVPGRRLDPLLADNVGRVACGEDGRRLFLEEIFQPADVVSVLVGEKDRGKRCGVDAELCEAQAELFRGQPGIDQDAGVAAFEDGCVSGGAGAEDSESHFKYPGWKRIEPPSSPRTPSLSLRVR